MKRRLFFIATAVGMAIFVAPARATEHDENCLRRVFDALKARAVTGRSYRPIDHPPESKITQVAASYIHDQVWLNERDATYKFSDRRTRLQNLVQDEEVLPDRDFFLGKVLEITSLPRPLRPGDVNTPALLHPQMRTYFQRMQEQGYALGIDTSLPLTGAGAYYRETDRLIALSRHTPWQSFLHEYQHLEFARYIAPEFGTIQQAIHRGEKLKDVLPPEVVQAWGPARTAHLEKLMRKRLPFKAVNETMAVEAELNALGFRRYLPRLGTTPAKYALRHQITALQRVAKARELSPAETMTLWEAKGRYAVMEGWEKWYPVLFATGGATAAVAGSGAIGWKLARFDESKYEKIFYDNDGNMIGVERSTGNLVYSHRTPLGVMKSPAANL